MKFADILQLFTDPHIGAYKFVWSIATCLERIIFFIREDLAEEIFFVLAFETISEFHPTFFIEQFKSFDWQCFCGEPIGDCFVFDHEKWEINPNE